MPVSSFPIKIITLERLLEMQMNHEEIILLEVLSEQSFNKGHVPGAQHCQFQQIGKFAKEHFTTNTPIIVYCENYTCKASDIAAEKLQKLGYENVGIFKGGKALWVNSGFDFET